MPDGATVVLPLPVSESGIIEEVRLWLDLSHPDAQGLAVSLEPPTGLGLGAIPLFTGGGYRHGPGFTQCCFASQNTPPVSLAPPPYTGTWQPEGNLAITHGQPQFGTWQLRVTDTRPDGQEAVVQRIVLETITRAASPAYASYTNLPATAANFRSFAFAERAGRTPLVNLQLLSSSGVPFLPLLTHRCWPQDTAASFRYWHSGNLSAWSEQIPSCEKWIFPDRTELRLRFPNTAYSRSGGYWKVESRRVGP